MIPLPDRLGPRYRRRTRVEVAVYVDSRVVGVTDKPTAIGEALDVPSGGVKDVDCVSRIAKQPGAVLAYCYQSLLTKVGDVIGVCIRVVIVVVDISDRFPILRTWLGGIRNRLGVVSRTSNRRSNPRISG